MTTVYGVTFIGARDQIEKQLRDIEGISREQAWTAASYLAKQVSLAMEALSFAASLNVTLSPQGIGLHRRSFPRCFPDPALAQHVC
jgi:DNA-directed RNA polymerase